MYGVSSPNGLINHRAVPDKLSKAMCMVHLKASDAPGYALYESLAARCPIVIPRMLIHRSHMADLFEPGVTCITFNKPIKGEDDKEAMPESELEECNEGIKIALEQLSDPGENKRIGEAGNRRLQEIMWSSENPDHVSSLQEFMTRCFS